MPRIAKGSKTVRLNLEMRETVRQRLEQLRERTDADSMTEVIRRAIDVYDFLMTAKENGQRVVIRDDMGIEREIVIV